MSDQDLAAFSEQVARNAQQMLGVGISPAVLDQFAREAVLDIWMTKPQMTVALADLALSLIRDIFTGEPGQAAHPVAA